MEVQMDMLQEIRHVIVRIEFDIVAYPNKSRILNKKNKKIMRKLCQQNKYGMVYGDIKKNKFKMMNE